MTGELIDQAIIFAAEAHRGQRRKYTGLPYIIHPIEVMTIVATVEHTEEMLAAAVLHDVVEDTRFKITDIYRHFGQEVHDLVWELTAQGRGGNRKARKQAEVLRWIRQSPDAQTVKLADLISNTASIVEHDPGFARLYLEEKDALLGVLIDGHPALHEQARAQVYAGLAALGS